jgi:hypothetical protein
LFVVRGPVEIPNFPEFPQQDNRDGFIPILVCLNVIAPDRTLEIGVNRVVAHVGGCGGGAGWGMWGKGETEGKTKDVAGAGFQGRPVDAVVRRGAIARRGGFILHRLDVGVLSLLRGSRVENWRESLESLLTLSVLEDHKILCLRVAVKPRPTCLSIWGNWVTQDTACFCFGLVVSYFSESLDTRHA